MPQEYAPHRPEMSSPEFATHGLILGFLKSALPGAQAGAVGRIAIL